METTVNPSQYNLLTNLNLDLPALFNSNASFSHSMQSQCTDKKPKIKRPMNSFILWSSKRRKEISAKSPELHHSKISKALSKEWKLIPQEVKNRYKLEANELKIKHFENYPDYKYKPRRKKKVNSLPSYQPIYLIENKPLIQSTPNVIPDSYTGHLNNCMPYVFDNASNLQFNATAVPNQSAFMNYKNNDALAAMNLLYYTPLTPMNMASPMMGQANVLHSTSPSTFGKKCESNDVYGNNVPQNLLQLTPPYNQPTRTPLSEYNQQQMCDNNLITTLRNGLCFSENEFNYNIEECPELNIKYLRVCRN